MVRETTKENKVKIAFANTHLPGIILRERNVAAQLRQLPNLSVISDPDWIGCNYTAHRACRETLRLAELDPEVTHVCVLSDDMELSDNFAANVTGAVAAVPDKVISLFCMRKTLEDAAAKNKRWGVSHIGVYGGSSIWPVAWMKDYLIWEAKYVREEYPYDDRRMGGWLVLHSKMPVWYTVPSLLQHLGANQSMMGHSNYTRISKTYKKDLPVLEWQDVTNPYKMAGGSDWLPEIMANLINWQGVTEA